MALKQRITVSQLRDLSPEGKLRLAKWWIPEKGDYVLNGWGAETMINDIRLDYPVITAIRETCLPLLSIGQLLSLIDEFKGQITTLTGFDIELIDALWEEAKIILEGGVMIEQKERQEESKPQ